MNGCGMVLCLIGVIFGFLMLLVLPPLGIFIIVIDGLCFLAFAAKSNKG